MCNKKKGVNAMANTTNFSVRMDSDIKKQCEALYGELGVNLTTAINVFLRQSPVSYTHLTCHIFHRHYKSSAVKNPGLFSHL